MFAKQKSYVHRFTFKDEEGDELSDAVTIIIIELSKLKEVLSKAVEGMTDLEKWSIYIGYADSEEQRDLINQIIEKKEEVSMASELLQNISKDEHERARFRSRRIFENDLESNMNFFSGSRIERRKMSVAAKIE